MDLTALDGTLRDSIEDRRLSRGERKDLRAWIQENVTEARHAEQVRSRAFAVAREILTGGEPASVVAWLEDIVGLLAHHTRPAARERAAAFFSPGEDCYETIVAELRAARRSADICVFTITDDRITQAILAAVKRRVAVRVISDDEKVDDRGSDLDQMERAGIPVALDRSPAHMHHKFAVFDGARLLTGSFNWTRSASHGNHENLLVTTDPDLLRAYQGEFDRLWAEYGRG